MPSALREAILAASDIEKRIVEVPEWGIKVEVRSPTGAARAAIAAIVSAEDVDYNLLYPALLIPALYDPESGERVFADGDGEALNEKSGAALERLATVALELAAITPEAVEAGKAV